jgi:large subunit ribosomal protein L22
MEAIAKTRNLKGSPRKARLVIDLIRGRNVSQALNILKFTDKRAAAPIAKTLRSAIANATYQAEQQNIAIDPDDLWVKTCFVDMGVHKNRRRMRPAPQGRAYRETRHYCHITILVSSDIPVQKEAEKPRKKGKKLLAKEAAGGEKKAKASTTKTAEKKETKKAKKEEPKVEEIEAAPVETIVETPQVEETVAEQVEAQVAKDEGEIADAKNVVSQTPAEMNETQPADEKQQDINEELERQ